MHPGNPKETKSTQAAGNPTPTNPDAVRMSGENYSFYETVIQLEKSMAQMVAKADHLTQTVRDNSTRFERFEDQVRNKLEDLSKDVHATKISVKVAAWIIGFFMTLLTLIWAIASRFIH